MRGTCLCVNGISIQSIQPQASGFCLTGLKGWLSQILRHLAVGGYPQALWAGETRQQACAMPLEGGVVRLITPYPHQRRRPRLRRERARAVNIQHAPGPAGETCLGIASLSYCFPPHATSAFTHAIAWLAGLPSSQQHGNSSLHSGGWV